MSEHGVYLAICKCCLCESYRKEGVTFISSAPSGLEVGDVVTISGEFRPWWKRLWHWVIRYKPPVQRFEITEVSATTMTVRPSE